MATDRSCLSISDNKQAKRNPLNSRTAVIVHLVTVLPNMHKLLDLILRTE